MSVRVELADLAQRIEEFGSVAYLVTVNSDTSPHVVSVDTGWDDRSRLVADVGKHSLSNVSERPEVSLLWPARPRGEYGLIVDGRAERYGDADDSRISVDPRSAVLHRTPRGDPESPSCVRVLERR